MTRERFNARSRTKPRGRKQRRDAFVEGERLAIAQSTKCAINRASGGTAQSSAADELSDVESARAELSLSVDKLICGFGASPQQGTAQMREPSVMPPWI